MGHLTEKNTVTVSLVDPRGDECLFLSDHSWSELNRLYGDVDRAEFFALDFSGARSAFVIARQNGRAVGCGAIRQLASGVAEIKRVFVEPAARQLGIGRKILAALESIARDLGYKALQLETGVRQPAAIRLYETAGYQRIPGYGRYRDDPMSVCFKKDLTVGSHEKHSG